METINLTPLPLFCSHRVSAKTSIRFDDEEDDEEEFEEQDYQEDIIVSKECLRIKKSTQLVFFEYICFS